VLKVGKEYDFQIAGMQPDAAVREKLEEGIRNEVEGSNDPERVGKLVVDFVRWAAASNPGIGKGVMLNNLPRDPGPPTGEILLVGKVPDLEVRTFTYIPENGYEGRYLGPLVAGSGGIALGDFQALGTGFPDSGAGMSYSVPGSPPPPKSAIGQSRRPFRIGRNDPCWCESGKKYKKCHGR
jgi:SEC-C motif